MSGAVGEKGSLIEMYNNNFLYIQKSGWTVGFDSMVGVWLDGARFPWGLLKYYIVNFMSYSKGLPPFAMTDREGILWLGMGSGGLNMAL